MTDAVAAALARARDAGIALAVITARPRRDVDAAISARVPDSAYWAYSNGAVIHCPEGADGADGAGAPQRVVGFAPDQVARIVEAVGGAVRGVVRAAVPAVPGAAPGAAPGADGEPGGPWSCALDLVDRTVTIDPFPRQASRHWNHVERRASAAGLVLDQPVPKVLVHTGTVCDAAVVARVQRAVGAQAVATASGGAFVELVPPGTGKSEALKWICARLAVDPSAAVAVGDGLNDLTMLDLAGLGAAPANAPEQVRLAADLVLPSNDEGAVAALVAHLLGPVTS